MANRVVKPGPAADPFRNVDCAIEKLAETGGGNVRALSAACSTGEGAYLLAMSLERLREAGRISGYSVTATDPSPWALWQAERGEYDSVSFRLPGGFGKYVVRKAGGKVAISRRIRERIIFTSSPPDAGAYGFDIIL